MLLVGRLPGKVRWGARIRGPLRAHARRLHLGQRLLAGPPAHQGLGLGEEVGHELGVMVAQRILAVDGGDEVRGDHLGPLVDELVEGVLAVGAGLAPDHGAGGVFHRDARRGSRACRCSPCRPVADRPAS